MKVWAIAVGNVNPFVKASRDAVKYIKTLHGLVGVLPKYPDGTLIFFRTENQAKIAKNMLEAKGVKVGYNICKGEIDEKDIRGQ